VSAGVLRACPAKQKQPDTNETKQLKQTTSARVHALSRRRRVLGDDERRGNVDVEILLKAADAAIVAATEVVLHRLVATSARQVGKVLRNVCGGDVALRAAVIEVVRFAGLNRRRGARVADQLLRKAAALSRIPGFELLQSLRFVAQR
jgi:hypothetical protein